MGAKTRKERQHRPAKMMESRFKGKVVVVTGGARGIGQAIVQAFLREGAVVHSIDRTPVGGQFHGDISDKGTLERFADYVLGESDRVDYLIHNVPPLMRGIDSCSYEEFALSLNLGALAPFYLTKLLAPHMPAGGCIVNISSTRDRMSQAQTESYAAAKGALSALTHAMAVSFAGKLRVNSVSPGWIDPHAADIKGPDASQQPCGRVGTPADIAAAVLFLCSDEAGFITGENLCVDGGMTRQMIYHGDEGWHYDGRVPKE